MCVAEIYLNCILVFKCCKCRELVLGFEIVLSALICEGFLDRLALGLKCKGLIALGIVLIEFNDLVKDRDGAVEIFLLNESVDLLVIELDL